MSLVNVRGVTREYKIGGRFATSATLHALRGVDLDVREREVVALVGESGSGKSTLARLLLGIEAPTQGTVTIDGRSMSEYHRLQRARLVQPVFQDPYSSLNPRLTVAATIAAPLEVQRIGTRRSRAASVRELMDAVGLPRYLAHAFPAQLSGGQRQRVAVARALVSNPRILVCDEPTSALDVSVQAQILNLIAALHRDLNLTIVLITHNLGVVGHLADRIAVMYLGRIVESGPVDEVLAAPRHPYTATLLEAVLRPEPGAKLPDLDLRGEIPSPTSPPSGCGFNPRCPAATDLCRRSDPTLKMEGPRGVACHHPLAFHAAEAAELSPFLNV